MIENWTDQSPLGTFSWTGTCWQRVQIPTNLWQPLKNWRYGTHQLSVGRTCWLAVPTPPFSHPKKSPKTMLQFRLQPISTRLVVCHLVFNMFLCNFMMKHCFKECATSAFPPAQIDKESTLGASASLFHHLSPSPLLLWVPRSSP